MIQSASSAMVSALANYLKDNMPSVVSAMDHFPEQNEELEMPAVSVYARQPVFQPLPPYLLSKGVMDPDTKLASVKMVNGIWDFALVVDIWCPYKAQRDLLIEELIQAFNPETNITGINVQLTEYHDIFGSFSIEGDVKFNDQEEGSQRGEWRVIVNVAGNCRSVKEFVAPIMETIETNLEVLNEAQAVEQEGDPREGDPPDYLAEV